MKIDLVSSELRLSSNKPIRLSRAQGLRIHCVSGTIWVTAADLLADIFLTAGESHRIDSQGLVLIESINEGFIRLEYVRHSDGLKQWLKCWWGSVIRQRNSALTATALSGER